MPPTRPNIVQLEFFHYSETKELAAVIAEAVERASEGSSIKTGVRIFDHSGKLTQIVKEYADFQTQKIRLVREMSDIARDDPQGKRRYAELGRKIDRVEKRQRVLRTKLRNRARTDLTAQVHNERPVALEERDHSFRPLRDDERHELNESIRNPTDIWAFVFAPRRFVWRQTRTYRFKSVLTTAAPRAVVYLYCSRQSTNL